ncbi:MAG: hypothetical protein KC502_10660 [Myxococcales bacterium]|nr:hypothetical protein [Myxococcales bacterium]
MDDTQLLLETAEDLDGPPKVEDELLARRAEEICAHLLIRRYLPKKSCRDLLLDDELRDSVRRRLSGVGLELVDSYTSDHFAVRLAPHIESDVRFDWATNTRLPRGALALLVILWSKLVLPRRVAGDEARRKRLEQADGDGEAIVPPVLPRPTVARAALYAEFGHRFGKTSFTRYVGQLKNAGFITESRAGDLREGPLLDLLIDGVQMARKLRDSVLWDLLDSQQAQAADDGYGEEG